MAAEAGHTPNFLYVDQTGNFHLNGAKFFDSSETDISTGVNVVGLTATAAELNVLHGVTAGTVAASSGLVVDANGALNALTIGVFTGGIGASTAAAGSTNSDAAALPLGTGTIYPTTAADGTKGVILTASDQVTGRVILIGNQAAAVLKVYPPSGGSINGGSADGAFSSVSGKGAILVCLSGSGNTWLAW